VGDEAYKSSLIALAKSLKVDHRLHFAGVVRGADKYYVIKKAKLMTHMALWESYCNAVHEGMSQGLVCIVANNTALPLLIKNGVNGYCIETHDDRAFAKKVKFVLDNFKTPAIKKIQQHNRTSVREHSWENVAYRVHSLYQTLRGDK
jgi:glycosyltransferase involved in cell wall biosynthesis